MFPLVEELFTNKKYKFIKAPISHGSGGAKDSIYIELFMENLLLELYQ
jgi:hypothetical protein